MKLRGLLKVLNYLFKMLNNKQLTEEEFLQITSLKTLQACRDYMKIMTDYYYEVIYTTGNVPVSSIRLNDARTWFQMMFSKGVHFAMALDGIGNYKGLKHPSSITDHTILFSLVRDMFESYIAFRLIFTFPKTDQQKDLIYHLFVHAGLQERLDNATGAKTKNPQWAEEQKQQIEQCKLIIQANELYKKNPNIQKVVDNALSPRVNKYRYRFTDDGILEFVHFDKDETLQLLGIKSSVFEGMYHYFSLMSHPSYIALDQFSIAYRSPEEGSIMLASSATRYAISILSLFLREYEILFPEVGKLLSLQPNYTKWLILLYSNIVFKDSANKS